jgi:addiction module RelE/StbE family toxin
MKAVWARAAIRDLTRAHEFIARENPEAAREIALRIVDTSERAIKFPEIGRTGRVKGTRELVVADTQYLIVYRVKKNRIHFLRVLHGRQKWPREKRRDADVRSQS